MEILPTTSGTRPGLACELRPEGAVAARRVDGSAGTMAALSRSILPPAAFRPGLRVGGIHDRQAVVAALRQALEKVMERSRIVTLVVPDASVRVLLLDFDALPGKAAEALPIVRFRLKKLLPFEADDAAISYQIMSSTRGMVRVVAIAMPRAVLAEYESVVREAGFEPGAVLPSTLAVLAGLEESDTPALLVNAGPDAVTAAIVRGGVLLLHRSVDMRAETHLETPAAVPVPSIPAELLANPLEEFTLPLIDRESSAEEWARQEAVDPYAAQAGSAAGGQTAVLEMAPPVHLPASEIVQAVSVAAAYFEDTLGTAPSALLAAGQTSAAHLGEMLAGTSLAEWPIDEATIATNLPAGQGPAGMPGAIPRGWLAGVQGALRG